MLIWISIILLLITTTESKAIKILLISPKFGGSHVKFTGSIADKLVEAGFEVTVLLPEVSPLVAINGTKLAKRIIVPINPKVMAHHENTQLFFRDAWHPRSRNPFAAIFRTIKVSNMMADMFTTLCEHILTFEDIVERLKNEKFDLAMVGVFDGCGLGLIELLQIPAHIILSPSPLLEHVATNLGVPIIPSYVPAIYSWFTDRMSYRERAINLLFTLTIKKYFIARTIESENQLFQRKFGDDFIDLNEKIAQTTFVLTNVDPFFNFPQPILYKVIDLGDFSVPELKPLDENWKSIMERRPEVVLVSFGSIAQANLMPRKMKQAFLHAFDQFPNVTFVWKYENDDDHVAEGHDNVVTGKWLPQNEILAHPNLIAFITHGGMNSITESARSGKPVITIPLFGDQVRNARMAERAGFGIHLSLESITSKGVLVNAIATIINNKEYSARAAKLARMIAKRPNPPLEQLIRHVTFAAEFGHIPNLDPVGRRMSFISYFMLDIIVPFVLTGIFICVVVFYLLNRILKRILFVWIEKQKTQ